jgi:hypothetical protein
VQLDPNDNGLRVQVPAAVARNTAAPAGRERDMIFL